MNIYAYGYYNLQWAYLGHLFAVAFAISRTQRHINNQYRNHTIDIPLYNQYRGCNMFWPLQSIW